jgi:hypothetical protein
MPSRFSAQACFRRAFPFLQVLAKMQPLRCIPHQFGKLAAPLDQRPRPAIFTIDHQQVERHQLSTLAPGSGMQAVKVGPAVLIVGHGLAIQNARVDRKSCQGRSDGPGVRIETGKSYDPHQ